MDTKIHSKSFDLFRNSHQEMKFLNKAVYCIFLFLMMGIAQLFSQTNSNQSNLTLPGAPTIAYAKGYDDQLSIWFHYPTQDEVNNPIINYEYSTDDGVTWIANEPASTDSYLQISGLENCATYSIKLRAVAEFTGAGPASDGYNYSGPLATTITSILPRDNALKVNINTSEGNDDIINYEYSIDGGTSWTELSPPSTSSSITISGLTNGTTYAIAVKPIGSWDEGQVCPSAVISATPNPVNTDNLTLPGAPTIAYAGAYDDQLSIWFDVPSQDELNNPITNYEYSTDDGLTWLANEPASTDNYMIISGLENCSTYSLKVRAVAEFTGAGPASDGYNYTGPRTTITSILPRDNALKVNINNKEANYEILNYEYSIDGGTSWTELSPPSVSSPLTISGLANGTTYAVAVKPISRRHEGQVCPSAVISATPNPVNTDNLTLPGAPTIYYASADDDQSSIWFGYPTQDELNNPITNYEYSTDDGLTWIANEPASTDNYMIISGLENCATYSLKVRAVAEFTGAGPASDGYNYSGPLATTISSILPRDNALKVNINASEVNYEIFNYEYSIDGGTSWTELSPPSTSSPLTISGLTNGTTYAVAVKPISRYDNSQVCPSAVISATPNPVNTDNLTLPGAPTIEYAKGYDDQLSIVFDYPTQDELNNPIINYEYSTDDGLTWIANEPTSTDNYLQISGLESCTTYSIKLRAVAEFTGAGPASEGYNYSGPRASITSILPRDNALKVNINTSEVNYDILNYEYSIDGGTSWTELSPPSDSSSITISGLTNGTTYAVAVRPISRWHYGQMCPSAVISATPDPVNTDNLIPPGAPIIYYAAAEDDQMTIMFDYPTQDEDDNPITNFEYSMDEGVTWIANEPASIENYIIISGVKNYPFDTVKIRAVAEFTGAGPASSKTDIKVAVTNNLQIVENTMEAAVEFKVEAYPNPYSEQCNLSIQTPNTDKVQVQVYDMIGRLIESTKINPSKLSKIQIGNNYPSGIYNVMVKQGMEVKTVRVIKK